MTASAFSGPLFVYGVTNYIPASATGFPVPDYNPDAGPGGEYQGDSILDPRFMYPKDKVTGYTGAVACHYSLPTLRSIGAVPAALSTAKIAFLQAVTNGTPMTLAGQSTGVAQNIPMRVFANSVNGGAVTTPGICLDFGFAFGSCTAGSTTVTVADSTLFTVGMPLVIARAGNSFLTLPLLTNVASIASATTITITTAAPATVPNTAIGIGDLWGPSVVPQSQLTPLAHQPWLAAGSGWFLDPRQCIQRGISITGITGGLGGAFLVAGYDIYGVALSQLVTAGAGVNTVYSTKTFKYIASVTPQFTDTATYSVGTSDVFGFAYRNLIWDDTDVCWASGYMASNTGFVAADTTNPATSATGDVRGTIQVSANGGGTGIGANATNGAVSGLVMTGRRLTMSQSVPLMAMVYATPFANATLFGQTQA